MTVFSPEEIDRITKVRETNDKLEEYFSERRKENIQEFRISRVEFYNNSDAGAILRKLSCVFNIECAFYV